MTSERSILDAIYDNGSAPIPAELIQWYPKLGLNLFEGYGMTEDFAHSHSSTKDRNAPGFVGVPLPGVEVKLAEDLRPWLKDDAVRSHVQEKLARLLEDVNRELPPHQRLKIRRNRIESAVALAVDHWYATGTTVH